MGFLWVFGLGVTDYGRCFGRSYGPGTLRNVVTNLMFTNVSSRGVKIGYCGFAPKKVGFLVTFVVQGDGMMWKAVKLLMSCFTFYRMRFDAG